MREGVFANTIAMLCGMSAVQAMAILDGSFEAIEELEREGLVRVYTDIGTVCGIITGSFPTIIADENLTKLRVDNVMDLETPKPYNLVHDQGVFRVAGYNMVLDDVGSTVYLTDKMGVTYEVVIDEVISKQLFKGHTAALLEAGDYKLVVNGAEQPAPVHVTETNPWVMRTFGRDDLVGQEVTFKFRYEDGTETGEVVKTIHAAR